jgi:hypothetical protein
MSLSNEDRIRIRREQEQLSRCASDEARAALLAHFRKTLRTRRKSGLKAAETLRKDRRSA